MSVIFSAIFSLVAAAPSPAPVQGGNLTLEEALAIAERNAFSVRIAQSNLEKSRQRLSETRAALGPKVNVGATYTRFDKELTAQIGGPDTTPIVIQPIDSRTMQATFTMPLDLLGHLKTLVRASQANLRASENNLQASRADIRLQTKRAFFNVLRAESFVGVQELALRDAEERREQMRKRLAAGDVAPVDLMRFDAQVAQAQSDLIAAQNALQLTKQVLNQVLARPIETPVDPVDVGEPPAPPADAAALVRRGESLRPEVRSLQATIQALEQIRRAQELSFSPTLNFSLNHQRNLDASGFSSRAQQTTGVLALSIPVFDSGLTRTRVKQARQDEEQARIQLEALTLGISQEVRSALQNMESARARLETARKQVQLAEEVFRLAKVRQDAGEATYVEVIDAEVQVNAARNAAVAARYDYLAAYSELQRAIGVDDLGAGMGGS